MVLKVKKNLRGIFIRYIICFGIAAILLIVLYAFVFYLMLENNIILPANYSEHKIEGNRSAILKADKVTSNLIPYGCSYGVYNEDGKLLYGNFTTKQAKEAWTAIKNNQNIIFGDGYLSVFHRKKDICIIQYSIKAQFKSPLIRKHLANVELLGVVLLLILLVGEVVLLAVVFGKYLSKEIKVLIEVSDNIKRKDLDFEPKHSDIREIEEVIDSLNDMKNALKESLEKQWNMEKLKKNQISTLAHDIKTPLTIIKGNAELIKEISIEADNMKYNDYILKSADEIEKYLKLLIDITKSEDILVLKQGKIRTEAFFRKIVDKESALASEKNLELISEVESAPEFFYGDEELLYRSIMNVISNAIEYSPEFGKLILKIYGCKNELEFSIEDNGHGFSEEELQFAAEQFYRGDKSRISKNHYGMGLFITSSFIKLHGGVMKLSNSEQIGGAKVVLGIPLLSKSIIED